MHACSDVVDNQLQSDAVEDNYGYTLSKCANICIMYLLLCVLL